MNKDFINDLLNSKFFSNNIIFNYDVVCVFLAGSRSMNIIDERSDYDLVVITKDKPEQEEGIFRLSYKDIAVHWYYRSLEQIIHSISSQDTFLSYISGINLFNIEKNIIWINPIHKTKVNFILNNKEKLVYNSCWDFIFANPVFWDTIKHNEIPRHCYNKYVYHLCNCYYILFNKDFEKEFLIKIKRLRWTNNAKEVLKDELQKAYILIKELYNYQESHNLKRKEIKEELLSKLKEVQ